MKSIKSIATVLFSVIFMCLTSCGGGAKKGGDSTHVHDDGSVHQDHAIDEAAKPKEQETFKVKADSTTTTSNPAHDHDHGHDHGDGNAHKH